MREYGKIVPRFWTSGTGAQLKGDLVAKLAAAYLSTCPTAHPIGIFYLPIVTMAHELGVSVEKARAAMLKLAEVGFAQYDEAESLAWVPSMASVSFGDKLASGDKRRPWILKELDQYRKHRFFRAFLARYGASYGLVQAPSEPGDLAPSMPHPSPSEGASKVGEMEQGAGSSIPLGPPEGGGSLPAAPPLVLSEPEPKRRRRAKAAEATALPDGWGPKPKHYALGDEHGLDRRAVDALGEKFKANAVAKGVTYVDWDGGFTTWILRQDDHERDRSATNGRPPRPRAVEPEPGGEQRIADALRRARGE